MARNALNLLICAGLGTVAISPVARAQDTPQSFTLTCVNNGGKSIYFSIDLASRKWALMKVSGQRDSEVQDVATVSEDFIKLSNPGGFFNINRKTGVMELIKGESRKVDRIMCRKYDRYIPLPEHEPATNKF